jgi:hypothetical protein
LPASLLLGGLPSVTRYALEGAADSMCPWRSSGQKTLEQQQQTVCCLEEQQQQTLVVLEEQQQQTVVVLEEQQTVLL